MNSRDDQSKQLEERKRQDDFERKPINEEEQREAAEHQARQQMFETCNHDELGCKFPDINHSQRNRESVQVETNEPDVTEHEAQDTNVFDLNSLLGLSPELQAHILKIGINDSRNVYQLFDFVTRVSHINKHFRQLMERKSWTDEILNKLETFLSKSRRRLDLLDLAKRSIEKNNLTSFKYLLKVIEKTDFMELASRILWDGRHEMLSIVLSAGLDPNQIVYCNHRMLSVEPELNVNKYEWFFYKYAETLLHSAWDVKSIEMLVDKGAVPISCDRITLLHYAARCGRVVIIDKLINDLKLNPNTRDYRKRTPLHYAAYEGNLGVLKKLIERGADPAKTDQGGLSAFDYAKRMGKKKIIQYLSKQGYDPHRKIYDKSGNEITTPMEILMDEFEYVISGHETIKTLLAAVNKFAAMDRSHLEVAQHEWMQVKLENEAKKLLSTERASISATQHLFIDKLLVGLSHSVKSRSPIMSVLFVILSEYLKQRKSILAEQKSIFSWDKKYTEAVSNRLSNLYLVAIDANNIPAIQKIATLDSMISNHTLFYALLSECKNEIFISLLNIYKEQQERIISENKTEGNRIRRNYLHVLREVLFRASYESKFEKVKMMLDIFPEFLNVSMTNESKNSVLKVLRENHLPLEPWLIGLIHQSSESKKEGIIKYSLQHDAELLVYLLKSNEVKTDSQSIYHYLLTCIVEGGNFEVLLNDKSIEQVLAQRDSHFHVQRLIALAILYDKPLVSQKLYELIENHHLEDDFLFGEHIRPEFLLCAAVELDDDQRVEDLLDKTKTLEPKYFDQYPRIFNDWNGYVSYNPIHIALCSKKKGAHDILWIIANNPACDVLQVTPRMLTQVYEKNYFHNIVFLIDKAASSSRINLLTHFLHIAAQAGLAETNAVLAAFNRNMPLTVSQFDYLLASQDQNGNTMLHLAIQCEQLDVVCRLTNSKLVQFDDEDWLVRPNIEGRDWPGLTLPPIDIENNNGVTPLMMALMKGPAYIEAMLRTIKDKQSLKHHVTCLKKQMPRHIEPVKHIIKNKLLVLNLEIEYKQLSERQSGASFFQKNKQSIFKLLIEALNQHLSSDVEGLFIHTLLEWKNKNFNMNPLTLLAEHREEGISTLLKPASFKALQKYLGKAMLKRIQAALENAPKLNQRPGQPG